jgi:hypothetical protein
MPKKRKGRGHNKSKEKSKGLWNWFNEKILWLSAIGLLGVGSSWVYAYFMNDINLRYSKKIGSGYEFNIENSSSTDREIERLRVELNSTQGIIGKFNRDVYVNVKNGKVDLPGGNVSYIPATEFEELDGMVLSAGSSTNFRIPPLLSQSFISPDYLLVDVVYKTRPTNSILALFERVMAISGLWNSEYKLRYLVADNYWTPVSTNKHIDVLKQACRENHNLRPRPICS